MNNEFSILSGSSKINNGTHHNIRLDTILISRTGSVMFKIVPPIHIRQAHCNKKIELFTGVLPPLANAWFGGWGCTKIQVGLGIPPTFPKELVITHLPIISNQECALKHGHNINDPRYICTLDTSKRRATSLGDEGGPLVFQNHLIGVLLYHTLETGIHPDVFINLLDNNEHQWNTNAEALKIEEKKLHVPPLSELQTVFRTELLKNFAEVTVEIVESPDLTQSPYNLAATGLGGNPILLDVGGTALYDPQIEKQKLFDLKNIVQNLNRTLGSYVMGAAGGPWIFLKKDCDVAVNIVLNKPQSTRSSYIISLDKTVGKIICQVLPFHETRFAVQGSLFLSDGRRGEVIKVCAENRIGEDSFIASMRRSITNYYGDEKLVGIGGVFVLQKGKANGTFVNVLEEPIPKDSNLTRVPLFYVDEVSAKATGVGTFVSARSELELTPNHFHLFSRHLDGGHYASDTTPAIVKYEAYFLPADFLMRVDQAPAVPKLIELDHLLN
ncbi:ester hydrolase C11orf54 homolog [Belonocnema kinseyi]|uniref:ester hydrolase C11orf54 homolog n=1 Tax=Belonocnema kinseyi TaxID=2817044 RepID=UPI00143D61FB|nr:ester hydrolase C11orf54 homolog [Belonocnema kinseyi]